MSARLVVAADELRRHAARLDGVVARAREGVEAGRTVAVDGDAYGRMCGFVGAALDPVERLGIRATQDAVRSIRGTAARVRDVAELLESTDLGAAAAFARLAREVPS